MTISGWIGVDLDGTLAEYVGWNGGAIGKPVPKMLKRVKEWIDSGVKVKIMTARVSPLGGFSIESGKTASDEFAQEQIKLIENWCIQHIGESLEITYCKDFAMIELWDDRAIQIIANTGIRADGKD